jgi:hypothetical protein
MVNAYLQCSGPPAKGLRFNEIMCSLPICLMPAPLRSVCAMQRTRGQLCFVESNSVGGCSAAVKQQTSLPLSDVTFILGAAAAASSQKTKRATPNVVPGLNFQILNRQLQRLL